MFCFLEIVEEFFIEMHIYCTDMKRKVFSYYFQDIEESAVPEEIVKRVQDYIDDPLFGVMVRREMRAGSGMIEMKIIL